MLHLKQAGKLLKCWAIVPTASGIAAIVCRRCYRLYASAERRFVGKSSIDTTRCFFSLAAVGVVEVAKRVIWQTTD